MRQWWSDCTVFFNWEIVAGAFAAFCGGAAITSLILLVAS